MDLECYTWDEEEDCLEDAQNEAGDFEVTMCNMTYWGNLCTGEDECWIDIEVEGEYFDGPCDEIEHYIMDHFMGSEEDYYDECEVEIHDDDCMEEA